MGAMFQLPQHEAAGQSDEAPAFVVPGYLTLTPRQLEIMVTAGQQPGVPFRIGGGGAVRPQGERRKALIVNNLVYIRKNSLCLVEESLRTFSVRFIYDAQVTCKATIYLGAKDKTNGQRIRIGSALQLWGPFKLSVGKGIHWNSLKEKCLADESCLPGLNGVMSTMSMITSSIQNIQNTSSQHYSTSTSTHLSTSTNEVEKLLQREVLMAAYFTRIINSASRDKDNNIHILIFHSLKVLMNSGVYLIQDIYGMDKKKVLDTITTVTASAEGIIDNSSTSYITIKPTATATATATAKIVEGDEDINNDDNEDNNNNNNNDNDADSDECVICLTDPRVVVVFPCRHMCLCLTCADALPSLHEQSNSTTTDVIESTNNSNVNVNIITIGSNPTSMQRFNISSSQHQLQLQRGMDPIPTE
eukprot:gene11906-24938_t